ncbi:putative defensin-like protein 169 [Capsella rubella]|uniref:putative defensin-like protein 169 n=1 Tax=Capsella rubella TaxID=81985 RepID=UPI000CD563E5|nr:putative defensin-like protein 169 [Capsella rubella]
MKKSFSFTILILLVISVLVTGLEKTPRSPTDGWCATQLPDQKPGKCNQDRCNIRCKNTRQFQVKGQATVGTCTSSNRCLCTWRCR